MATEKKTEDKKTTASTKPPVEEKTKVVAKPKPIEEPKEVETIEVKKEDLAAFVKRLSTLEDDNKRLLEAADKGRLANIDAKLAGDQPLVRTVKLSRMTPTGPIIVAWSLEKNVSFMDGTRMVENQRMKVFFEDGSDKEMPLIEFYRDRDNKTIAEIISRKKPEKPGELEILEVETKDGKRLEIPLKFVN
jgi:hypothetical protein